MISKKQIEHIAKLARVELTEKEKKKFGKELSLILAYVEKLKKVNTSKIKDMVQATGLENVMREDEKIKSQKLKVQNNLLEQAPKRKGDYFQVPKILD